MRQNGDDVWFKNDGHYWHFLWALSGWVPRVTISVDIQLRRTSLFLSLATALLCNPFPIWIQTQYPPKDTGRAATPVNITKNDRIAGFILAFWLADWLNILLFLLAG
jgi:hypothetical protein